MHDILMQTDFGGTSGAMIGVCKIVNEDLQIFQITNQIPKFNVEMAAASLLEVIPYWNSGTVMVSVVDPGVGTARRASVAELENGIYIISPDNGIFSLIHRKYPIRRIREIDPALNRYRGNEWSSSSDIFHGRDLFAYCGAKLASGVIRYEEVGPSYPLEEIL